MQDIIIIGSGPAGLSAAITARARGKSVTVVSNNPSGSGLYKAPLVDNYPGLPGISGAELSEKFTSHALSSGVEIIHGRVTSAVRNKTSVSIAYGSDFVSGHALILAFGIVQSSVFPGEAALLGKGLSYCATCDGMLYRNKRVVVVSLSPEAPEEAEFLRSIGCEVTEVTTKKIEIHGETHVEAVTADGERIPCEGAFILRPSITPSALLPGLESENGHIKVKPDFSTTVEGVFAAGDCVGAPYQIAKAVGEGQLAAFSAISYIDKALTTT